MQKTLLAPLSTIFLCAATLPGLAEVPKVVTDVPVVGSLVQQVMGDLGAPEVLLPSGGDPHDYQLRPTQARTVQDAGLLIWVGPGLTPWMDRAITSLAPKARSIALLDQPATHLRPFADSNEADHDHDHAEDHDHDHDHGPNDPHAWLDPDNGRAWIKVIADALVAADPDNTATYRKNQGIALGRIGEMQGQAAASLATAKGKHWVVSHDAYGYFAESFGLDQPIPVAAGDAVAPSAARLREIQSQIADSGAVCAFPEQNHDDRLLRAAIEGSATRLGAPLDPEGSTLSYGADLYGDLILGLAQNIAACLGKD